MNSTHILLVEDDANDRYFFERAVKKAELTDALQVARDGHEAICYLSGTGDFADRARFPLPPLIVLDLSLPLKHGLEVLKWLRANRETQTTIVIVLTSSNADIDVDEAYRSGANSYLVKPSDPTAMSEIAAVIKTYWLGMNRLPPLGRVQRG